MSASVDAVLEKASDGLSIKEAAEYIGVTKQTIRNWISTGRLPATVFADTIYRVDRRDLDAVRRPAVPGREPASDE